MKSEFLLQYAIHGVRVLTRGGTVDFVVRTRVSIAVPTYHITAPVPARTLSAKLGRYSSFRVLSEVRGGGERTALTVDIAGHIHAISPTAL